MAFSSAILQLVGAINSVTYKVLLDCEELWGFDSIHFQFGTGIENATLQVSLGRLGAEICHPTP
jgi:hypothetical protein